MSRLLIVEDEPRIASFLEKGFQSNGFTTTLASDGQEAIQMGLDGEFDLIILDIGLPVKSGLVVLEELRGQGVQLPIILLTARDDVSDKVVGFEAGADDYVTKPFRFEELLARVRARLRGSGAGVVSGQTETVLQFREITLDLRSRQAQVGDRLIELSTREFLMAEVFLRHPDQILSREQLLNHIWGYDYDPGSNIVDVYVGYLRRKLAIDYIETVRGMGYRLRASD